LQIVDYRRQSVGPWPIAAESGTLFRLDQVRDCIAFTLLELAR